MELCVAGTFGSICDNGWGDMDASVVCRQLGFSPHGAIALPGYIFGGSASRDSEYSCVGSEDKLASCPYQPAANTSCGRAGVVCQGEVVSAFNSLVCIDSLIYYQIMPLLLMLTVLMVNYAWWVEPMPPLVWSKSV